MELLISVVSLLVIVCVTMILLYQNAKVKHDVAKNLKTIISQINDSSYISYQQDKIQNDNLRVLDSNMKTLSHDMEYLSKKINESKQVTTSSNVTNTPNNNYGVWNDEWDLHMHSHNHDDTFGAQTLRTHNNVPSVRGPAPATTIIPHELKVKGGYSEFNSNRYDTIFNNIDGKNYIRGDTDIVGSTIISGQLNIGGSVFMNNNISGALLVNKTDRSNNELGIGQSRTGDFYMFNSQSNGSISLGIGSSDPNTFTPMLKLKDNPFMKEVTLGNGNNSLSIYQMGTDTTSLKVPNVKRNDFVIMGSNQTNDIYIQSGNSNNGVIITSNMIGIGTYPEYGRLDVGGNLNVRGDQISLGNNGIDENKSRAITRSNNDLIINQNADFENVHIQSDMSLYNNSCIEFGKGINGKQDDAGKICYKKYSDGLDITGARRNLYGNRKVNIADEVETRTVNAQQLCLGNTCIDESRLQSLLIG